MEAADGMEVLTDANGRQKLLDAILGPSEKSRPEIDQEPFDFYISYLHHRLQATCLPDIVFKGFPTAADPYDAAFLVMSYLVQLLQDGGHKSIEEMIQELKEIGIWSKEIADSNNSHDLRTEATQTIFMMIGWLTCLYNPIIHHGHSDLFEVDADESLAVFEAPRQPVESTKRVALSLFLHRFGTIMPQKVYLAHPSLSFGSTILESQVHNGDDVVSVPFINAAYLKKIKKIRIQWTLSIGTHLDFDPSTRTLRLFCIPSVLALQGETGFLSQIINCFHDDHTRPDNFSAAGLFSEIRLSYALLFRNDPSSRKLYKKQRSAIRHLTGAEVDPILDRECGFGQLKGSRRHSIAVRQAGADRSAGPRHHQRPPLPRAQESYRKSLHFPIFAGRLTELQNFVGEEHSNKFWTILRDKSDTKEWSQFIVIVIFGGLALFLAVLNTAVAIVQIVVSIKTYNLESSK